MSWPEELYQKSFLSWLPPKKELADLKVKKTGRLLQIFGIADVMSSDRMLSRLMLR